MSGSPKHHRSPVLLSQLCWFIRLRWAAGATVVLLALVDWFSLHWYQRDGRMLATGLAILALNCAMLALIRTWRPGVHAGRRLETFAWAQICIDLVCLTLLAIWTGGMTSPLLGFYVFHMIFASLLLPRHIAYASAAIAILLFTGGLWLSGDLPRHGTGEPLLLTGWILTLVLTVHLANHITLALREQRRRLVRQNHRILRISQRLHRQQEALIRQEKMAALGQMAAGITHEIANPLASMDTLLQLLQRKPEKVTEQSLATLKAQVGRINQIVRQMTTFAHPGTGASEVISVNSVVESTLDVLQFDARLKQVVVTRALDPQAGTVRMVPQATQQVLINLIANALDAMAESAEPRLELRTSRTPQWCTIQVSDTGHGIRPEHLRHLFEPFFTTKPLGKGTGVGLSISYSMIRQQGGAIQVQSEPGKGTTFTVRLPVSAV
jgi:signal transduction histidine kinase